MDNFINYSSMKNFNIILIVYLLLFSVSVSASEAFTDQSANENNSKTASQNFSIYTYWTYSSSTIKLRNRSGSTKKMDYFYCGRDGLGENGIKVDFFDLQLYYAVSLFQGGKNIGQLIDKMSDSDTSGLYRTSQEAGLSYQRHRFNVSVSYRESNSYTFFENNGVFSDPFLVDKRCEYVFFEDPEISQKTISASLLFAVSDNMSLKNTHQYIYRNDNSSGSLITGIDILYCRLDSKTPIIPEEEWILYRVNDSFKYIHIKFICIFLIT